MHVQTHGLLGWGVANLLPMNGRQRLACLIAGVVADVDGVGIVAGWDAYLTTHHVFGHCLLVGVIACGALWSWSRGPWWVFATYLALFHSHLVMDYFGSGPGWPIFYWWPFSKEKWINWEAWNLFSWQNMVAFAVVFAWTLWIAVRLRRTPLEIIMPALDAKIVAWVRGRLGREGRMPRYEQQAGAE